MDFTEMKSEKYLTIYLVSKLFRVSSIFGNYEVLHLHQFCIKQTMASGYQVKPRKITLKIFGYGPSFEKIYVDFHEFLFCWWNNPHACCGLNFDATNLPHSSSENRYTSKFSGVLQKLTLCQRFGLHLLPK